MSSSYRYQPRSAFARAVHILEESLIAVILGLMTLVTFANVVMRYVFNSTLIWGLEVVLILFAWLILLGVSYCVKVNAHLGVDALTSLMPDRARRITALVAAFCSIVYALLLLKGAWDYWAPFAGLYPFEGRVIPTGFREVRSQAFYATEQVPMLDWLRFIEPWTLNRGYDVSEWESYEKLPRLIPYIVLPFGCALLLFRIVQATISIAKGTRDGLIVSHEAEEAVEEAAVRNADGV